MQEKPFRLPAPVPTPTCEYKDKPCDEKSFWTVWRSGHQVVGHFCKKHSARTLENIENEIGGDEMRALNQLGVEKEGKSAQR